MTIIGGLDVHRQQTTLDCADGRTVSDSPCNAQDAAGWAAAYVRTTSLRQRGISKNHRVRRTR